MQASVITKAFEKDSHLKKRVLDAANECPQHASLFTDIAQYCLAQQNSGSAIANGSGATDTDQQQPAAKKRKLENGVEATAGLVLLPNKESLRAIFELKNASFAMPQRKKLHLEIARDESLQADGSRGGTYIRGVNTTSKQEEFCDRLDGGAYKHILRLPVPEKAQRQYNFCLLPGDAETTPSHSSRDNVIMWTVNHGPLKEYTILDSALRHRISLSDNGLEQLVLEQALEHVLHGDVKVTVPDESEFVAANPEAHRKTEKAYHVKAFQGSKEGFLFFLRNGIFFGFKKPLLFFALDDIDSISYTSVLQRTFNLNISHKPRGASVSHGNSGADGPVAMAQEIEFSMLDQADFAGIDAYIKRHGLHDASMVEARRAKRIKAAAAAGGATEPTDDGEEQPSELAKAEQEMRDAEDDEVDEEDEQEEDYNPGSEGESEGEGASDESSGDEDAYAYAKGGRRNLVEEELGSEAEDVEEDDDGDGDEDEDEDGEEEEQEEEEEGRNADAEAAGVRGANRVGMDVHSGNPQPDPEDEDQL